MLDDINELCELTDEQRKAFASLKRAYKKCLKTNIIFHQVLDTLHALNGNNVDKVDDFKTEYNLDYITVDSMKTVCSWADDTHYVHLKKR